MSDDPTQQPQPSAPPPPPPGPQGAPVPPPPGPQGSPYGQPQGGYAPAPYAGAPAYGYGAPLPAVLQGRQLAGWGIRFGAWLIDTIFTIVTLLIGAIVNWFLQAREGERNGQTLGKQLCNIRVIKEDGTPVTFGFGFLRQFVVKGLLFGFIGAWFFFPWLLNYLWPLWDDKNQALHDKMVSSYVVQG